MVERMIAVNGVQLCSEQFGADDAPAVVLAPGATSAFDWWDDEFCERLAAGGGGYRVLRYDLRDTGRSTTRPLGQADYTGDDLVQDLAELIRTLEIAPAHVVGLSLGGGIAQLLAIAQPELVASLSLFSTSPAGDSGDPGDRGDSPDSGSGASAFAPLPPMSPELAATFEHEQAPQDWSDREAVFRSVLAGEIAFGGTIPVDESRLRRISDRVFDRSIDLAAGANQWNVPSARGRREQLAEIAAPTLVVHGTADPLFPIGHGEALAREIPNARLLPVPGMGHQFPPPPTWDLIVPALHQHFAAATTAR